MAPVPDRRGARWGDLGKRAASALVLIPVALSCIWWGGAAFGALVAVAGVGLAIEWVELCGLRLVSLQTALTAMLMLAAIVLTGTGFALWALAVLVLGAGLVAATGQPRIWLAVGLPYLGLGAVAVLWLRQDTVAGQSNLLFLLLLIWASDIGAYLVGRLVGGPKMAPFISPGKTWSGAAGGLLVAIAVAWLVASILHPPVSPGRLTVLAAGLGIVAQAGDLFESWIKRRFGVKDSGWLIPGHGGLFDRLDALLAAAPVAAILALFAGRGVFLWQ